MPVRHLSPDELRRFSSNVATRQERLAIVRHLLAGCERCAGLASAIFHLAPGDDKLARFLDGLNATARRRQDRTARERSDEGFERSAERLLGWNQWACLETLSVEERLAAVRCRPPLQHRGLLHRLLEAATVARRESPREGVDIALLAVELAHLLRADAHGPRVLAGLRADAWASLAVARRMAGDFAAGQAAIRRAEQQERLASREPSRRAELLGIEASILSNRRDHRAAESLLESALKICREAGDRRQEGKTLIQMGLVVSRTDPERSIRFTRDSMDLVDRDDRRLQLYAHHNLAYALNYAHRLGDAMDVFNSAKLLYRHFNDSEIRTRLVWLEGKLLRSLGNLDVAAERFNQVWDDFRRLDLHHEMDLVAIDLAWIDARRRSHEVCLPPIT